MNRYIIALSLRVVGIRLQIPSTEPLAAEWSCPVSPVGGSLALCSPLQGDPSLQGPIRDRENSQQLPDTGQCSPVEGTYDPRPLLLLSLRGCEVRVTFVQPTRLGPLLQRPTSGAEVMLPSSGLTLGYTLEHLISFKETRPTQQLLCAAGKGDRV